MVKNNDIPAIVQVGDPVLKEKAAPVGADEFGTRALHTIIAGMRQALEREEDGVAIAAPQIGIAKRIFVVSHRVFTIDNEEGDDGEMTYRAKKPMTTENLEDKVFINPVIVKLSKKRVILPEGCLSVRWSYGKTRRSDKAIVRAYDENGKVFTYGGSGLIAQIFQHETDHLDGILFTDHASDIEEIPPEKIAALRKGSRARHDSGE